VCARVRRGIPACAARAPACASVRRPPKLTQRSRSPSQPTYGLLGRADDAAAAGMALMSRLVAQRRRPWRGWTDPHQAHGPTRTLHRYVSCAAFTRRLCGAQTNFACPGLWTQARPLDARISRPYRPMGSRSSVGAHSWPTARVRVRVAMTAQSMAAECHMPICHMLPELRGVANGLMGPRARTGWLGTCASVAVPPGRPCPRPSGARRGEWRLVLEPCGATASLRPPCGAHTPPSPFCAGGWPARSTAAKSSPESVRALCPVWVRARVRGIHIHKGVLLTPSAALRRKVP
jgi:hypothetical protein